MLTSRTATWLPQPSGPILVRQFIFHVTLCVLALVVLQYVSLLCYSQRSAIYGLPIMIAACFWDTSGPGALYMFGKKYEPLSL